MEFCKVCNNKLYLIENEQKLYVYCKKCGHKRKNKKIIISSRSYKETTISYNIQDNKNIIYDNTLPRTNIKTCPNVDCISITDKTKQEAIFFPNKITRELNYVCVNCYAKWKST